MYNNNMSSGFLPVSITIPGSIISICNAISKLTREVIPTTAMVSFFTKRAESRKDLSSEALANEAASYLFFSEVFFKDITLLEDTPLFKETAMEVESLLVDFFNYIKKVLETATFANVLGSNMLFYQYNLNVE